MTAPLAPLVLHLAGSHPVCGWRPARDQRALTLRRLQLPCAAQGRAFRAPPTTWSVVLRACCEGGVPVTAPGGGTSMAGNANNSTRGRAHMLQEMVRGETVTDGWRSTEVRDVRVRRFRRCRILMPSGLYWRAGCVGGRRSMAQALAQRSGIVLEWADGRSIMEVSRRLGITADTVRTCRRRFLERGLEGCPTSRGRCSPEDHRCGCRSSHRQGAEEKPKNATHWSTGSMAAATGMSQSAISRI